MSELRRSYILHPAIGGSHPIPCLSTQITKRRGIAMYYEYATTKIFFEQNWQICFFLAVQNTFFSGTSINPQINMTEAKPAQIYFPREHKNMFSIIMQHFSSRGVA